MKQASPMKLRNGSWGVRVKSENTNDGEVVAVTTRAGKTWNARVTKVIWAGKGISICAVASQSYGERRRSNKPRPGYCEECGCDIQGTYSWMPADSTVCYDCE